MTIFTVSILALIAASILPMTIAYFMPSNKTFYSHRTVRGFGLGVYAALVVILLHEGVEHAGFAEAFSWFGIGLVVSVALGVYFKEFHHHHSDEEHAHSHTKTSISRILVSDFFHNIVDGIAILSGFGVSTSVGILSLAGVIGHQMIQQAGQQVLLIDGGIAPRKALFVSFVVSLSLGLGYFFQTNKEFEHVLIALSSGIIAWKIGADILHTSWEKKSVFGFFLGALLLAITLLAIPHGH